MSSELFIEIKEKYYELQEKLNNNFDKESSILFSKYTNLYEIVNEIELSKIDLKEFYDLLEDAETHDEEFAKDLQYEINKTLANIEKLNKKLSSKYRIIFNSTNNEYDNITKMIVEIRAGAGGDEGALFASDLFRMYNMYIDNKKWGKSILDINSYYVQSGELAIKRIVFEVTGKGIYQGFKYEAGIHKVIRNPITDASDRTHTSSATVAIVPVPDEINIDLKDDDLEIISCKSSGAGGQHVNVTDSAIMITHKPSGIVVRCQDERSQGQNKQKALIELKARLYKMEKEKQINEISQQRKEMVGSGDYSSRIRTYNFKKQLFYDHRIDYKTTNIYKIMDGQLDDLINELDENFVMEG